MGKAEQGWARLTAKKVSAMRRQNRKALMSSHALALPWCSSRITNMYSKEVSSTTIVERPTQKDAATTKRLSAELHSVASTHVSTSTSACSSEMAVAESVATSSHAGSITR